MIDYNVGRDVAITLPVMDVTQFDDLSRTVICYVFHANAVSQLCPKNGNVDIQILIIGKIDHCTGSL